MHNFNLQIGWGFIFIKQSGFKLIVFEAVNFRHQARLKDLPTTQNNQIAFFLYSSYLIMWLISMVLGCKRHSIKYFDQDQKLNL